MHVSHILQPGNPSKKNEDALYIGNNTFAVFDGATSLDGYVDPEAHTGGFLASHIAQDTFEKSSDGTPIIDRARATNEAIQSAMKETPIDITKKESLWSTTFAAITIHEEKIEWAQIDDSLIFFIHSDGSYTYVPAANYDHDIDTLIAWSNYSNLSQKEKSKKLHNIIVENRQQMNINYGKLTGELEALSFIQHGKINRDTISHILLITDGLIPPKKDPQHADNFDELIRIYLDSGLEAVATYVRNIELTDPECSTYPRFKQHDDIAAIAIRL